MLHSLELPTSLMVGVLLLMLGGLALAAEDEYDTLEPATATAYDRALLKFNTNIKSYPSWDAFKTEVLSQVPQGTLGTCYTLTGNSLYPMEMAKVKFAGLAGNGWEQTSGNGWRLRRKDRTFTEYRVNPKAGLLSRIEGVKPRFFFASTKRICEFPL